MDNKQIMRAIPREHRSKVEQIEHYPGGFAIWLNPGWTFEALDNNRGVEHYNYADAEQEGWNISKRIADDCSAIEQIEGAH